MHVPSAANSKSYGFGRSSFPLGAGSSSINRCAPTVISCANPSMLWTRTSAIARLQCTDRQAHGPRSRCTLNSIHGPANSSCRLASPHTTLMLLLYIALYFVGMLIGLAATIALDVQL